MVHYHQNGERPAPSCERPGHRPQTLEVCDATHTSPDTNRFRGCSTMKIPNISGRTGPVEAAYVLCVLATIVAAALGWWAVPLVVSVLAYEWFSFSDEDGDA